MNVVAPDYSGRFRRWTHRDGELGAVDDTWVSAREADDVVIAYR